MVGTGEAPLHHILSPYMQGRGWLRRELTRCLSTGRARRRLQDRDTGQGEDLRSITWEGRSTSATSTSPSTAAARSTFATPQPLAMRDR